MIKFDGLTFYIFVMCALMSGIFMIADRAIERQDIICQEGC